MSDKELKQIEKALSLIGDQVFEAVIQSYLDNYGLDMEVSRENGGDFFDTIYNIQSTEEDIDFEYFYDVLTTTIENAVAELLHQD